MRTETIKVPKDYYIEVADELRTSWINAKNAPKRQLDRIRAVIESGKDHEVMGNNMTVPLEKLMKFYQEALKVDVQELKQQYENFKNNHEIDPKMQGNLKQAKKDVELFYENDPNYSDADNNYELLHTTAHKYFLAERQWDLLMEHMMCLGQLI